tara:strand:+ start:1060 stop:1311 length:252 start_codon:yes stop_codon:yes gene_type:complete
MSQKIIKINVQYKIGDLVCYQPKPVTVKEVPASLGFIIDIKDEDLIKVHWYVQHVLPLAKRQKEWIPAAILEHTGNLKILSRA